MDIERARNQLTDMLADLDRSAGTLRAERPEGVDERDDYVQDSGDAAKSRSDADSSDALVETMRQRRARVQEALGRIENGTYGYCTNCGRQLSDERLEARPEVARCLRCEEELEAEL